MWITREITLSHKWIYTLFASVGFTECEYEGEEVPACVEVIDSDTELSTVLSTDEDISGKSIEELRSPPRKKYLGRENKTLIPSLKAEEGTVWEMVDAKPLQQNEFSTNFTFNERAGLTECAKRRTMSKIQSFMCSA